MKRICKLLKRSWRLGNKPPKATQKNEGAIRSTGRLIVHKLPQDLKINVDEEISIKEGYGIHREGAQEESVRIVDSEEQMVWADLGSSGAIGYTIEGKSRQGESGTHEVCSILLAKLNGEGASWNNLKDVSANESQQLAGIDCQACDENNVLNIQVTRVERSIWKDLAEQGIASREPAVESVVDKIRTVIIEKSKTIPDHEIAKLVLALNALETPVYAFERVVNDFRSKYGSSVKSFGYLSIWVVGPTESLTYRLDKKQVNSESSD